MDRDVILEKINNIQKFLATINRITADDINALDDIIMQDAAVLNLQRAVQLCIDMAGYLIADFKWGLPSNLKDCFVILHKNAMLSASLNEKMGNMVGFRNIAVHEYEELNLNIIKSIVKSHLGDFEEFYTVILNYIDKSEK